MDCITFVCNIVWLECVLNLETVSDGSDVAGDNEVLEEEDIAALSGGDENALENSSGVF